MKLIGSKNWKPGPGSENLSYYYNFEHDEGEEIIRRLKQAASEIAGKLEEAIVNQLCHKLQHGRNTCAEERKIQKSIKYVATKRNEKLCTNSATEIKRWIPYDLMEIVRSKESIKDIEQGLYNELHQQGDPKQMYRKKSRHLKKKSEALEKEICVLEQKRDKINSRRRKVVTYVSQLKTSLAKF